MTDTRDLRDPQKLGEALLTPLPQGVKWSLSYRYDGFDWSNVSDVSKDDSMGKQCVREYRAELEQRAGEGDRYAQSALDALNKGGKVEYDDPAGN